MKRARGPNFTSSEIMHLLLLVEKYPVIENKRTDGATSREKLEAWKELAEEYNSSTSAGPRTAENLMSCYKNQKVKVKKQHSHEKMRIAGKKKNVSESFQELANNKKELVELQKNICRNQLLHQEQLHERNVELHEINVELATEKLAFEKIKNEMELNFLRAKYETDLYKLKNKE